MTESDDVDKLSAVGVILGKADHHAEARTVLEKAVALDSDSSELHYNLALSCFYLKLTEDARRHAAAALAIRPDFPEANVLYGTILYLSGADEEALPALRRANRLRPDDASVRQLLGEELLRAAERTETAGELQAAEAHLTEASKIMPDSREIAQRLAALHARREPGPR
jgi:tetratricopeptide (TPR) repeat protein